GQGQRGERVAQAGRRLGGAAAAVLAVDEALEQAVRGEAVGAVQAAGGDLAGGPQAGQGGASVQVHDDAADHVVGAGAHGDQVARDVQAEAAADLVDAGEAATYQLGVEVAQVEVDVGVLGTLHLSDDGLGDDVARRQLGARV